MRTFVRGKDVLIVMREEQRYSPSCPKVFFSVVWNVNCKDDKMQACDSCAARTTPFKMLDLGKEKNYLYLLTKFKNGDSALTECDSAEGSL